MDLFGKRSTVRSRPTRLAEGYQEARNQGVGVDPGANEIKDVPFGNPIQQIGGLIKKAMAFNPYTKKPSKMNYSTGKD